MGQALRCSSCGASLPSVAPERAAVVCPSCGQLHRFDSELMEALHGHRRELAAQRQQAASARRELVGVEVNRSFGGGWAAVFVISWLLAGVVAIPGSAWASALAMLVFLAPFGVFIGLSYARQRRLEREVEAGRVREHALLLHCPTCGGQSECLPEQPVLPCRYCSGALAADEPARVELLARAQASASAEQQRTRVARWRLAASQNREPRTDLVPYMVNGGLGSLWVIGTLIVDLRWLLGAQVYEVLELLALNLSALMICAGIAIPWSLRRKRLRKQLGAMQQLGEVQHELAALSEWLIAHWSGEFASTRICAGLGYGFVACAGPPWWAVSFAPWTVNAGSATPHLRVLVPGRPGAMLDSWVAGLRPLGFDCRIEDGGLVATLRPDELARWIAKPQELERLHAVLREC